MSWPLKKLSERLILHNYSYVYTKNQTEVCVIFFLLIIKMDFRGWYLISKAEKKLGSLLHGLSKLAEIELPLHAWGGSIILSVLGLTFLFLF